MSYYLTPEEILALHNRTPQGDRILDEVLASPNEDIIDEVDQFEELHESLRAPVSDDLPPTPTNGTTSPPIVAPEATEGLSWGVPDLFPSSQDKYSKEYVPKHPFGERSKGVRDSLCPQLVHVVNLVADVMNVALTSGHRGREEQTQLHIDGYGIAWPRSYHNHYPSEAVDIAPYPVDYDDLTRFYELMGIVQGICIAHGYKVTCGGHWKRRDFPHFQVELDERYPVKP